MLVKMYINAHYICAMCRNSKSVAKKVAIFKLQEICKKRLTQKLKSDILIFVGASL